MNAATAPQSGLAALIKGEPTAPNTLVRAHVALHGLISMGLRLNEKVEGWRHRRRGRMPEAARMMRSAWVA